MTVFTNQRSTFIAHHAIILPTHAFHRVRIFYSPTQHFGHSICSITYVENIFETVFSKTGF